MMPAAMHEKDEPGWVRRLREDGFDVRGGDNPLPEEPDASFPEMPRSRTSGFVDLLMGLLRLHRRRFGIRHHAPVP